ncbi:MAG: DnaJ domain-containing protein, partial [Gemmatimonadota bacterium]
MSDKPWVDHYETLQLSPSADPETIERVYRLLAKRYHPDNERSGDFDRFNQVRQAYEVLSDKDKRARYDQYGHAGVDAQMQDFWGHGGFQDSHAFRDFGDMFGDVFGD